MDDLPSDFFVDLSSWYKDAAASPSATRYFINASGNKYVLEHDEDFCSAPDGSAPPEQDVCDQMNADAADADMNAAAFMKATAHASNATAYMLDPQQIAWIQMRDTTCHAGPDSIPCRVRMTRERTQTITGRPAPPQRRMAPHTPCPSISNKAKSKRPDPQTSPAVIALLQMFAYLRR